MFSLKPVLYILGVILSIIGASMLLPIFIDIRYGSEDWRIFGLSALITLFFGLFLIFANKEEKINLNLRQAILLTPLTWIVVSTFAALPFYIGNFNLSFAQAFFEAVSGITTTGATVLVGLDDMPKGILLWRGLLQYLGGLGIIAAALIILPMLGIGGMQLFKNEAFGSDQKYLPRASEVAKKLFTLYTLLCMICAFCYYKAGMNGFDAITHSFFTLANGGFSNYDASIGHFNNPWIEFIGIVFMLLAAMPIIIFLKIIKGNTSSFFKDGQIKFFLVYVTILILTLTFWVDYTDSLKNSVKNAPISGTVEGFLAALRYTSFNLVSMITTCGFVTTDYYLWGSFAQFMFILVVLVGGCMGSTSGGIKIFRLKILFQMMHAQIKKLVRPHGVFRAQYEHKSLSDDVLSSVACYFFIFLLTLFISTFLIAITGLDILTSFSAAAALLGNAGPGLGSISGPAGNYSSYSDFALYVGSFTMLLGRLEILALLALLGKSFWRE